MNSLSQQLRWVARGSRPLGLREFGPQRRFAAPKPAEATVCPSLVTEIDRLTRVEGVLFLAKEALPLPRIAQLASLADATEARTVLERLTVQYARHQRAFTIENVAGGYRLLTRPQFAPWLGKIGEFCDPDRTEFKLTPPALDTLTVVAYRQPVLRSEVEAIRGVACGELLRQLIERDLLRIVGRSEELGRPLLYGTTKRFLQMYGLKSLKDLPMVDGLYQTGQGALATPVSGLQNTVLRAA